MPVQPAVPIWQQLLDSYAEVTVADMSYGTIHQKEFVPFLGCYPGKFPKMGNKFDYDMPCGVSKEFFQLNSPCTTAFLCQERIFDNFLLESGVLSDITDLTQKAWGAEETLRRYDARIKNGKPLSDEETQKYKSLEKTLEKNLLSKKNLEESMFTLYKQFMGTRADGFDRHVNEVLTTERDFDLHKYVVVAEAFRKDAKGKPTDERLPDKDNADPTAHGADFVIVHRVESCSYQETKNHVKDSVTFTHCRWLYRLELFKGHYDIAETQREYLTKNLRLPKGGKVTARVLLTVIRNISDHMYLLPTYAMHEMLRGKPEIVAANVPFTNLELCCILKRAMPRPAVTEYEAVNSKCPIAFDPDDMADAFDKILDKLALEESKTKSQNKNPNKSTGGGKTPTKTPPKASKKFCKHCSKNKKRDAVIHSHNTADCDNYHPDGSRKDVSFKKKEVHNHNRDDDDRSYEHTPRSSIRKKKKKSSHRKKDKKKSKRRRRSSTRRRSGSYSSESSYSSSSSYASSDSD